MEENLCIFGNNIKQAARQFGVLCGLIAGFKATLVHIAIS